MIANYILSRQSISPQKGRTMGLRQDLERKVEKKKNEIEKIRAEIQGRLLEIEKIQGYISGLQDAIKSAGTIGIISSEKEDVPVESKERGLRIDSLPYKARMFLQKHGKPAHISEILNGISVDNTRSHRVSLGWSLNTYSLQNQIFVKSGPNVFGLKEYPIPQKPPENSEENLPY